MIKETAIVLVNWNQKELTENCIDSLLLDDNQLFDIFLLDNGSVVNCRSFFEDKYNSQIKVFRTENNLGFTGGNNYLLRQVLNESYEYVLLLNNDTTVEKGFLLPLIALLKGNDKIGAVTGKILFMHDIKVIWGIGGHFNRWLGRISNLGYNKIDKGQYDNDFDVDYISGCLFMCRTSILKQIGTLEESLFAYFEDFDLSIRIKKAGYRLVYTYKSVIYHVAGASGKEVKNNKESLAPFVWYLVSRNHLVVLKKHLPIYIKAYIIPFLTMKYLSFSMLFFIKGNNKKASELLRGVRASLKNT